MDGRMVMLKALEWEEGRSQPLPMQDLWLFECKMHFSSMCG